MDCAKIVKIREHLRWLRMTRRRSCRAFDRGSTVVEISTPSGRWRYVSRQTSQKKTVRGVRTLIRVTGPGTELWELAGTRDPELGPRIEDPRRSQLKISIRHHCRTD